jgi:hypothetical protein
MSFLLTTIFDDKFEYKGKIFNVDMSFDNILRLYEMFDDDTLFDEEKPFIAMKMLIIEELPKFDSIEEAVSLFKYVLKEFLEIDLDEDNGESEKKEKTFDFSRDAEIIFASFYSEYGIDLIEMQGKLHWRKFIALMNNLDDESKFKQVIGIRTMKIPKTSEVSQEYRDHIIKMKEVYSLDDREKEEKINEVFDSVAMIFKSQ